ncbi:MAG: hypothetical protein LC647_03305, partial [Beggiatoa sp.]|nr:hypothetical protein [Beggiatoa sp.]
MRADLLAELVEKGLLERRFQTSQVHLGQAPFVLGQALGVDERRVKIFRKYVLVERGYDSMVAWISLLLWAACGHFYGICGAGSPLHSGTRG